MDPILTGIIAALVAGATAKAKDVASDAVKDAYDGLKALIQRKLGKVGAVQSVEDEPDSDAARALLAQALTHAGLHTDEELKQLAAKVDAAIAMDRRDGSSGLAAIDIASVRARVNVLIQNLVAAGNIKLGPIVGGDVTIRDLSAGIESTQDKGMRNSKK